MQDIDPTFSEPSFSLAVIDWQQQHGRQTLPWQNTTDAYRIWLSEIMLQQTQVSAVIPYYGRFLERFPTVQALAAADAQDVMAHWSGLGYYSRARNLHRCAQRICAEFDGRFPADPVLLADLPGIGRSTAAAISAFAYGTRAAILDGNVKRVFCRMFGIDGFPGIRKIEEALWRRAEALLPVAGSGQDEGIERRMQRYTQGLMDLGATICTRSRPACGRCPLQSSCVACNTGRTAELPVRKPKKTVPEKHAGMLVVVDAGQVLLQQRPGVGIWGGLLSLPEFEVTDEEFVAAHGTLFESRMRAQLAPFGRFERSTALQPFSHGFTHFKLHVLPFQVSLLERATLAGELDHVWFDHDKLAQAPLPAPVKKLLLALLASPDLFNAASLGS
ncbi:MAG: A/G-specific adenine glycosylase [Janthinobacterium lividum]